MSKPQSWGARWIVPMDRPPVQNASLIVVDGVIQEIREGQRSTAETDLGEVAIIPSLVNAHTHLEFSSLHYPLGQPGMPITDWIRQVVSWRSRQSEPAIRAAIITGLHESRSVGCQCLGEIASTPWFNQFETNGDDAISGLDLRVFVERLGTVPADSQSGIDEARQWLQEKNRDNTLRHGISPHAPYSLCDELFEGLIRWSL